MHLPLGTIKYWIKSMQVITKQHQIACWLLGWEGKRLCHVVGRGFRGEGGSATPPPRAEAPKRKLGRHRPRDVVRGSPAWHPHVLSVQVLPRSPSTVSSSVNSLRCDGSVWKQQHTCEGQWWEITDRGSHSSVASFLWPTGHTPGVLPGNTPTSLSRGCKAHGTRGREAGWVPRGQ